MINLIKLCVGVTSVDELIEHREYYRSRGLGRADGLNSHRTRMMPKRRDEIVGKGSLYWVMGGAIRCRQLIVDLEAATDAEGRSCCDILLNPEIVNTVPQPRRPFQGWRYLPPGDAPADIDPDVGADGAELAEELARLGLI